jgi:hypothetical protein
MIILEITATLNRFYTPYAKFLDESFKNYVLHRVCVCVCVCVCMCVCLYVRDNTHVCIYLSVHFIYDYTQECP